MHMSYMCNIVNFDTVTLHYEEMIPIRCLLLFS